MVSLPNQWQKERNSHEKEQKHLEIPQFEHKNLLAFSSDKCYNSNL
jgi:hypothetical protein